ncbi:hypothetical protein TNIN_92601 [Trichonephila inaurata madagascariensis]|uniref:Uncharacterized protein n=1 Tax=Trichonephila inaurata madagascariensis TaxID=2747483 RepID=A0A8X6XV11_9ARAC|nr:hypothetical protein TNIN_92601 [Trichonephila inaurata madagascariensis]
MYHTQRKELGSFVGQVFNMDNATTSIPLQIVSMTANVADSLETVAKTDEPTIVRTIVIMLTKLSLNFFFPNESWFLCEVSRWIYSCGDTEKKKNSSNLLSSTYGVCYH